MLSPVSEQVVATFLSWLYFYLSGPRCSTFYGISEDTERERLGHAYTCIISMTTSLLMLDNLLQTVPVGVPEVGVSVASVAAQANSCPQNLEYKIYCSS